jgi:hypothetical protein
MKTTKTTDRRKFLVTAGLGGAGAAAVALGGRKAAKLAAAAPAAEEPSGYRVTEHILKYYKTTQV